MLNKPALLELPERRWGLISMDFIMELTKKKSGFDAINTTFDRISRRVQFIPINSTDTAKDTAKSFFVKCYHITECMMTLYLIEIQNSHQTYGPNSSDYME